MQTERKQNKKENKTRQNNK